MAHRKCCKGCEKRRPGCRADCEKWAAHEAEKAELAAKEAILRAGTPGVRGVAPYSTVKRGW